jgi:hypothetical protein
VIKNILMTAKKMKTTANQAAIHLAEERLAKIGQIKQIYAGKSQYAGRLGEMNLRATA